MDSDDAFLQAILPAPNDDMPRVQYADWLEEQGDPRGDFILLQVELARMDEDDERRPELEQREWELLEQHKAEWVEQAREDLLPHLRKELAGYGGLPISFNVSYQ